MAPHRDYHYCIIHIGTTTTRVQFAPISGLHESLPSKVISIPSKVYAHPNGEPNYFASTGTTEVQFIKNGHITNHHAFNYFVKLVYKSVVKYKFPDISNLELVTVHLMVITSGSLSDSFSKVQVQKSINYFYENLDHLTSITLVSNSVCLLLAHGGNSVSTALAVDIGEEKLTITSIVDYLPVNFASVSVPIGGHSINSHLSKLLPGWTPQQIEDLKRSDIYEILSDANKSKTNTDFEEELDVLSVVNAPKPKEILEKRSKKKSNEKEEPKQNSELEFNTFIDSDGVEHNVGKQRFLGAEELIDSLDFYIDFCISRYPDVERREELWSNIIFNGPVTSISGFKDRVLEVLSSHHLVSSLDNDNDPESKFRATSNVDVGLAFSQAPTSINTIKKPDYFQEWKDFSDPKGINNDLTILGAVVYIKLCFGPGSHHATLNNIGNDLYMVKKEDFEESGPNIIWDLNH
ncbi:Arp9 protein [Saccharomycopsis crataegensis]|uniref:Arp9 protein n=1 Tax=Saccharomycopsis crataegensis TaxID=43959 RepID=A0AAV5QKK9_9ASCO|nr:Arp9 protein [Saccharomycopsis crataegensis]